MDLPDKTKTPQPKKKIEPVTTAAKEVKRPATRRFLDSVFAESPRNLGAQVTHDVIVPRIKAGFEEAFNSFLSGMLWGSGANRPSSGIVRGNVLRGGTTNYHHISSGRSVQQAHAAVVQQSSGNYRDIATPTLQEAEAILANMYELLDQYRVVAVGDLYELAGITSAPSDNSYGWRSLDGARISKVREGFALELPRPKLI